MPFTHLTNDDKLRSLIYVSQNELHPQIEVQNKQIEVLKVFWNTYIKECAYYNAIVLRDKNLGRVYTFDWDHKKLVIEECDRLLKEFKYQTERYNEITLALTDALGKVMRPTLNQLRYFRDFTRYCETWIAHDAEVHVNIFKNPQYLDNLTLTY